MSFYFRRSFLSSPVSSTLDKPEEKATMSSPWWALLFGKLPLQVRAPGHRSVEKTKDHRMYLLLDVVRDTMGIFEHVGLVPKNGDKDLSEKKRAWLEISLFFHQLPPPPRHRSGPRHLDRCLHRWWTRSNQSPDREKEWNDMKVEILTSSKGIGCFSLLTKKTPLFLRALGQSVWMMRWPAVFWEITIDWGSSLSRKAWAKEGKFAMWSCCVFHTSAQGLNKENSCVDKKKNQTIIIIHLEILPLFIVHHNLVPFVNFQSHRLQREILQKFHSPILLLLCLSSFLAHLEGSLIVLKFLALDLGGPMALGAWTWAPNPEGQIDGPQITGILSNYWYNFQKLGQRDL